MKSVAAICLALLLMCADAMALTLRNFNEYAMDVDEALAEIYIHPLHEEPELYQLAACFAISAENSVAVLSGPAPDEEYHKAISVYGSDGRFRYGYEIAKSQKRGMDTIFFIGDDLCAFFPVFNTMLVLGAEGQGVTHAYSLTAMELSGISDGHFTPKVSVNDVKIDPQATYQLVEYAQGRLVVADAQGRQICLYDQSDRFGEEKRKTAIKMIGLPVVIGVLFMVAIHPWKRKSPRA